MSEGTLVGSGASSAKPETTRAGGFWASKRRRTAAQGLFVYLLLAGGGVLVLMPFVWMVSTSLKEMGQVFLFPPVWIPNPVRWDNYIKAATVVPFGTFYLNTVIVTGVSIGGIMLSSSLAAYAFSRLRWPGRNVVFVIVLATMMLPTQVTLIPQFIIFRSLKWIDTFLPLIVPAALGSAFQIFLLRQFFMTIPMEMDEAARMDGCSILGIFWRIIVPLSKPALAVGAIFAFRYRWDQFLEPLIFLNSTKNYTLSLGLRLFQTTGDTTSWHYLMAASCMAMMPVLITFFLGQRYFIQGVVVSGVKG
jgi:ABC-type glycerol-3-phosphate transport system permease component